MFKVPPASALLRIKVQEVIFEKELLLLKDIADPLAVEIFSLKVQVSKRI